MYLIIQIPNLTGPIPQGNQFGTFGSISYNGNFELCGNSLPRKCGNSEAPKLPTSEKKDPNRKFFNAHIYESCRIGSELPH